MREAKFTKPISIALSPKMYDTVKTITDEEKISMSEWFRDAAERALAENPELSKQGLHYRTLTLNGGNLND